ncbi:ABC transporter permease [Chitinibacter sp. S2-10]|uniref:ABC transporter permease n=1 Tax=Chitinibacter sp. S2-10 TaxID=3373597 RepID=UPI003977AE6B
MKIPRSWILLCQLSLRLFRSSMIAGEYKTLLLALVIAIASLSAVGSLTERVQLLLLGQTNQLQAADLVLIADHEIEPRWQQLAQQTGLQVASSATFPSMVSFGEQTTLASVKAVSAAYPLRGKLLLLNPVTLKPEVAQPQTSNIALPLKPGEVLIDPRLQALLKVKVGERVQLGQLALTVRGIIDREPDAAFDFASLQARLIISEADLPRSGLIGFGSRVKYRLMVAGSDSSLSRWQSQVVDQLARGERLENIRESRPELKQAIDRAEQFLRLAALLAGVLAAVAIVLAARRFALRHFDTVALLRTFGASQRKVRALLLGQLLLLVFFAALLGGALAWLAQTILVYLIADQLPAPLPGGTLLPWAWASLLGLVLLLGTAGPVLLNLAKTPPLRVLRRELTLDINWLWQYGITLLAFGGILLQITMDLKLAAIVGWGIVLALALVAALSWLLLKSLQAVFRQGAAKIALRQMLRQRGLLLAQLAALTLGLCGLWLLTVVQNDLLSAWRQQVPSDAPNFFAVNLQPEQQAMFTAQFVQAGLPAPKIQPMIRGRWVLQNGRAVIPKSFAEPRAQRLAEREFNLSWGEDERADNLRVAGLPLRADQPGWSVESGLAEQLGIKIGDTLTFDIAGTQLSAPVVNLRKVNWGSFRANFFVVGSAAMMREQPGSLISSFYLPPTLLGVKSNQPPRGESNQQFIPDLVHALPNVTVIDVRQVLAQVESVISLASAALRLVFVMCMLAGLTVLLAALDTNEAERRHEAALMRALGASTRRIAQIWWLESLLLGAVAGLMAGAIAALGAWYIAHEIFELPWGGNWGLPIYSAFTGMLLSAITLWRRLMKLAKTTPMLMLQE